MPAVDQAAVEKAEEYEYEGDKRLLGPWLGRMVYVLCIGYSLFHLAILNYIAIDEWVYRVLHVNIGAVIAFALLRGWRKERKDRIPVWDWLLAFAAIGCSAYIVFEYESLIMRTGVITTTADVVTGLVGTLLVVEFARRVSGLILPIIAAVFVAYVFVGQYLPGVLHHSGFEFGNFFSFIYSQEGIFGITAAASSRYIILFVAFAVFLQACGAGEYFMRLAMALFGWTRGGPGKVAVVSGLLFGTVSGSAVANVVASGTFTIPMMRRAGYPRATAGAIEATSSTGGQLAPPVMGAGAFIMAEITGIPYSDIVVAAILPCLLFYIAVFASVDLQAIRHGVHGLPRSELPPLKSLGRDVLLLLPLIVLLYILLSGYSIIAAGTWGVASTLLVLLATRMNLPSVVLAGPLLLYIFLPLSGLAINQAGLYASLLGAAFVLAAGLWMRGFGGALTALREMSRIVADGLADTAQRSLQLIAVMACAGIVVGVLGLTGLGGRFSSLLISVAGNSQFIAFGLAMFISILLGMGMPTTAAYAIAASVVAPALQLLGVEPLPAHMFVFYCAVISAVTPPVAIAAFAASAIAESKPFDTALQAMRFGIGAFVVPFLFYSSPEILVGGDPLVVTRIFLTATAGVVLLAMAGEGRLFGEIGWPTRIVLAIAAGLLILGGSTTDLFGAGLAGLLALWRFQVKRRAAAA
ncbi:TRAP transporter fused permease subunit [Telmatospirillum sp. J64-1]|uniref:TRAP transporter permease n=1 Tax=Telmatospirillum sp. J64-1 TaxID=2502183 RepID=UPI001C8F5F62|nr:TRAP transporter fused permease subunit [Telmatospirillum sp. J64-1]